MAALLDGQRLSLGGTSKCFGILYRKFYLDDCFGNFGIRQLGPLRKSSRRLPDSRPAADV